MVRTFRNPQGGSLGGVFDGPNQSRVSYKENCLQAKFLEVKLSEIKTVLRPVRVLAYMQNFVWGS